MPYSQQVYYGQTINNLMATKQLGNAAGGSFTGGALAGWTTGSAVGPTVTFFSTTANTNVSNLTLVSSGTAITPVTTDGTATTEKAVVTFQNIAANATLTLAGLTFTAGSAGATANQLANAFKNVTATSTHTSLNSGNSLTADAATVGSFSASSASGWTSGAATGATVTFSSTTPNSDVSNLVAGGSGSAPAILTTAGSSVDTTESAAVTFLNMTAGQTISAAGLTFTAGSSGATAAQVANAFANNLVIGATAAYANSSPLSYASQYVVTPGVLTNTTSLSGYIARPDDGNATTFIATGTFTVSNNSNSNANANTTVGATRGTITSFKTYSNGALSESITYGASVDTTLFGVTDATPVTTTVLSNQRAQAGLQFNSFLNLLNNGASFTGSDASNGGIDQVQGGTNRDFFTGNTGNDYFDGKAGIDTAIYRGQKADYIIGSTTTLDRTDPLALNQVRAHVVTDLTGLIGGQAGRDGSDTLVNVERLQFTNTKVALDLAPTQSAGQTALLLGAVLPGQLAFDVTKQALLGSVISLFDQNFTLAQLSGAILRLPIWDVLTGNEAPTTADIATYLVNNVYGSAATTAITNAAITAMNSEGRANQGNYLASLAVSSANQTHINLVGIQSTGLEYLGQFVSYTDLTMLGSIVDFVHQY